MCIYIYIYMYVCVCVCMCTRIYTYGCNSNHPKTLELLLDLTAKVNEVTEEFRLLNLLCTQTLYLNGFKKNTEKTNILPM